MDPLIIPSSEDVRMSGSPRRSPQITESVGSPVRSVHPQMQQMDSMYSQPDYGLRTADFFDDTSEEGSPKPASPYEVPPDEDLLPGETAKGGRPKGKKRQSVPPDEPTVSQIDAKVNDAARPSHDGYQLLAASATHEDKNVRARTPSSSVIDSVDELLPGETGSPPQFPQRPPRSSLRAKRNTINTESSVDRMSKIDQTLGAYAIAHDITLQALLRDQSGFDQSLQGFPFVHTQPGDRQSVLPPSLRVPDAGNARSRPVSSATTEGKKVHVVPPPIDTTAPHRSLPEEIVRTPYPFSSEPAYPKTPNREGRSISMTESALSISIRQSNSNRRRVCQLTIPASNEFSVVRSHSPRTKDQHCKALDFDDAMLFHELRKCYRELTGPFSTFSARSLRRISVNGSAMKEADRSYWLPSPRSPHAMTNKILSGTFSEERIMQHYRKPSLGKSRYAFVHWAHRLASAPPLRTPPPGAESAPFANENIAENSEGLEFVVCWSAMRILLALLLVLITSAAAPLLWIFLGHVTTATTHPTGGFRDAGDRVTSGLVIGICLLLFGLSSIAGWLGVSWLVI